MGARLTDHIEYSVSGVPLTDSIAAPFVRLQLKRMFDYRHAVTKRCCETGGY